MTDDIDQRLDEWTAAGLIDAEHARRIRDYEAARDEPAAPRDRLPAAAEAVGYLGAVLAIVAGGLVVGEVWDQLTAWGRVTLAGLVTVVLLIAGASLRTRDHPAVMRLTGLLWLGAVAGVAATAGLGADQRELTAEAVTVIASGAALLLAAVLYALRRTALQLIALSLATGATALSLLSVPQAEVDVGAYGLLLWGLGVAWALLAAGGWLRPERTATVMGLLAVGIGCQVGTAGTYQSSAIVLALVSAAVLIWLSVVADRVLLLGFGVAGVFVFVPQAVFVFVGDSIGAPLALLLTGLLLVATAVGMVVLRRGIQEGST